MPAKAPRISHPKRANSALLPAYSGLRPSASRKRRQPVASELRLRRAKQISPEFAREHRGQEGQRLRRLCWKAPLLGPESAAAGSTAQLRSLRLAPRCRTALSSVWASSAIMNQGQSALTTDPGLLRAQTHHLHPHLPRFSAFFLIFSRIFPLKLDLRHSRALPRSYIYFPSRCGRCRLLCASRSLAHVVRSCTFL